MVQFFTKLGLLITNPKELFVHVEKEKKIWPILLVYVGMFAVVTLVNTLLTLPEIISEGLLFDFWTDVLLVFAFFATVTVSFAIPFIVAGATHLGVLVFGGKKGFFNTFKPVTYALMLALLYSLVNNIISAVTFLMSNSVAARPSTPQELLEGVVTPAVIISFIIAVAGILHVVIVEVMGLKKYQKMTTGKAAFAVVLIPLSFTILFSGLMYLVFIALMAAAP